MSATWLIALAIISIVALSKLPTASSVSQCTIYDSNMGATFDLADLSRMPGQPSYMVEDGDIPCTTQVEQNYTYIFNVCGPVVDNIPTACNAVDGIRAAGAIQINKRGTANTGDDFCYLVGSYTEASTTVNLLNHEDPTEGIVVTYHGAYCNAGNQRKFIIELPCANRLSPIPTHALEYHPCEYTITMPSVYGCPMECPVANRQLCAGNGHCAYDEDTASAHCFCDKGYAGSDCAETEDTSIKLNYSPALLGLIITLFIIVFFLMGGVAFMVKQLAAYKADMDNYQVLKSGDEEVTSANV